MVYKRINCINREKIFDDVVVGFGTTALGNLHQDHLSRENQIQDLRTIQFTDLDMLFLHQVVVQMQDHQQMDLFYKNQTHQLDQQILKFKHILDLDHLIMKMNKETLDSSHMLIGHQMLQMF